MRKTLTPAAPARGYSYVRFSTPQQAEGDSLRRQTAATEEWCRKNGVPLDTSLTLRDMGVSAYHGRQRDDKAALGQFLKAAREGRVPRGSYLIIENLDRLTREDERTALRLWLDLLDAGVNIVQLTPETVFRHERSDMTDIIRAIIELSRGHSESRMKSVRVAEAWAAKVAQAREMGGRLPCQPPAWIEERDGHPSLIAERAAAVKRIFKLAAKGYGAAAIATVLVKEGVAPFGEHVVDEEGRRRAKKGVTWGSGGWRRVYISLILRDRRVLGEFQPKGEGRRPSGPPIPGYYPAVVTEKEFYAARAGVSAHRQPPGRLGPDVTNLFTGLIRDARPAVDPKTGEVRHGTYCIGNRVEGGRTTRLLVSTSGELPGGTRGLCFNYHTFERAILGGLQELDPAEVIGPDEEPADAQVIEGELDWVRERMAVLSAELDRGDVKAIADKLRGLESTEAELVAKLEETRDRAAKPLSGSWRETKSLVRLLDTAPDTADVRLRLRAALRRIIDEIWILVVHRGKVAMCAVQILFAPHVRVYRSPPGYRNYTIIRRGPRANKHGRQPGRWHAATSIPEATALDVFDFSGKLKGPLPGDRDGSGVCFEHIDWVDVVTQDFLAYDTELIDSLLNSKAAHDIE